MIVEDDPNMAYLAEIICKTLNISKSIEISHNPNDALVKIQSSGKPDLILLDLNLPQIDGFEFLEKLSECIENHKNIKVVIVSCSDNFEDIEKAKRYPNVIKYFTKPFTIEKAKEIAMQVA
ncbi:MAG: hypothetical protein Kow0068_20170 [Marinilabiliales bacterium]